MLIWRVCVLIFLGPSLMLCLFALRVIVILKKNHGIETWDTFSSIVLIFLNDVWLSQYTKLCLKNMLLKCSNWGQKGDKYMFQSSCKRNAENSLSVLLQPHRWCHSLGSLCNDLTPWAHVSVVEVSIFHRALFIYFLKAEVRRNLFVHRATLNSRLQS